MTVKPFGVLVLDFIGTSMIVDEKLLLGKRRTGFGYSWEVRIRIGSSDNKKKANGAVKDLTIRSV